MNDYDVYMTYIGDGSYQVFIKNLNVDSEFIRIVIGYAHSGGMGSATISNTWIISPLKANDEPVFIQSINVGAMKNRRIWVLFQAMKRNKPESINLRVYASTLLSSSSRWRTRIGSVTHFTVLKQSGIKDLNEFNPKLLYKHALMYLSDAT